MAEMCKVWYKPKCNFMHSHAGLVRHGLNSFERPMAERLLREGVVESYKKQKKEKKEGTLLKRKVLNSSKGGN